MKHIRDKKSTDYIGDSKGSFKDLLALLAILSIGMLFILFLASVL